MSELESEASGVSSGNGIKAHALFDSRGSSFATNCYLSLYLKYYLSLHLGPYMNRLCCIVRRLTA